MKYTLPLLITFAIFSLSCSKDKKASSKANIDIRLSLLDIIQLNSNRKIYDKIIDSYRNNITEEDRINMEKYISWKIPE